MQGVLSSGRQYIKNYKIFYLNSVVCFLPMFNNMSRCDGALTTELFFLNLSWVVQSAADTIRIRYGPCRYDTYSIRTLPIRHVFDTIHTYMT